MKFNTNVAQDKIYFQSNLHNTKKIYFLLEKRNQRIKSKVKFRILTSVPSFIGITGIFLSDIPIIYFFDFWIKIVFT